MNNTVTVNINCDGSVPVIVNINCNNDASQTKQIAISQNNNNAAIETTKNNNDASQTKQSAISQSNNTTAINAAIAEIDEEWLRNNNTNPIIAAIEEINNEWMKKCNKPSKQYAYDEYVMKPIDAEPIAVSDHDEDCSDNNDDDYSDTDDDDTSPDYEGSNDDYSSTDGYSSSESISAKKKTVSDSDSDTPPAPKKKYISKKAPATFNSAIYMSNKKHFATIKSASIAANNAPVLTVADIPGPTPKKATVSSDSKKDTCQKVTSPPKYTLSWLVYWQNKVSLANCNEIVALIDECNNSTIINEQFFVECYNKYIKTAPCKQILADYMNFWNNSPKIKAACDAISQKRDKIMSIRGYNIKTFTPKAIHREIKLFLNNHLIMKLFTPHGLFSQKTFVWPYDVFYPTEQYYVDYVKYAVSKLSPGVLTHEQINSVNTLAKKYAEDNIILLQDEYFTLPAIDTTSMSFFGKYFDNKYLVDGQLTETQELALFNGKTTSFIEDVFYKVYYKKYTLDSSMSEFLIILNNFVIKFCDDSVFDKIVNNAKSYIHHRKLDESFEKFQNEYFSKFVRFDAIDDYIGEPVNNKNNTDTTRFKELSLKKAPASPPKPVDSQVALDVYEAEWNNEESLQDVRHRIDEVVAPANAALKEAYDDIAKYDDFIKHMKEQNIDTGDDDTDDAGADDAEEASDDDAEEASDDDAEEAGDDDAEEAGDDDAEEAGDDDAEEAGDDDDKANSTPSSTTNDDVIDDGLIVITKKNRFSKY
jgi:hypothetical protein